MGFADRYINIHKPLRLSERDSFTPEICVVIPCYREPQIFKTLQSLSEADQSCNALVIIVVNYPEYASNHSREFHQHLYECIESWAMEHSIGRRLRYQVLLAPDLRRKHAGAGLARKTGMDTAIDLLNARKKPNAIIASLDADTLVEKNYFSTIAGHFKKYPRTNAVTIDFTHEISNCTRQHQKAVLTYETYLRYFVLSLRFAGFPYAFHTIGSCFAVKAGTYVKQGGMNKKHAGEDFYFLHKVFPLGNCYDIFQTTVYPSGRISNRVPFGTGPAVQQIMNRVKPYDVYNFNAFRDLSVFYDNPFILLRDSWQNELPDSLAVFFKKSAFGKKIADANNNSSSAEQFVKRIMHHFNAFQVVKFLNMVHEKGIYAKQTIHEGVYDLMMAMGIKNDGKKDGNALLREYEQVNRRQPE